MLRSGIVSLPKWSKNLFPFFLSLFITSILPIQFADASADRWISTGGPAGGTISSLAINPTSPSIVYAGTYGDGVFRTFSMGDFSGDGKPDILWRNPTTGDVYLWYMNGVTHTGGVMLGNIPAPWLIVGVADFNADNKPDILWRNPSTGENYVWYMDGVTHTSGALLESLVGSNWEIQAVGDLNNDANPDIVWREISTGANMVWLMNGVNHIGTSTLDTIPAPWQIVGTK